ncbi:MAG: hypothetical protein LUC43_06845 [Burkholderiales bacterium]|nr:hypothetical protein [Burkholderiales bacterium]
MLALRLIVALCLATVLSTGFCRKMGDDRMMLEETPEAQSPAKVVNDLLHRRKTSDALDYTEKQLEENPKNVQMRFMRAVILNDLGMKEESKEEYEQMIREFPELAEPYNNLAVMYAAEGNTGRARELLEQALFNNAKSLTTYSNLGDVYLSQAADAYTEALKISPKNKKLRAKLQTIREMQQK